MRRLGLILCLWILACDNQDALESDCWLGGTTDGGAFLDAEVVDDQVCTAGVRHNISILILQPEGEEVIMTREEAKEHLRQAEAIARVANSESDSPCCVDLNPSVEVRITNVQAEINVRRLAEIDALLGRQLATIVVVKSLTACIKENHSLSG